MKFLMMLPLALFSLAASARSIQTEQRFVFPRVSIDEKETPYVAVATVQFMKARIRVEIYSDPCGSFTAEPGAIRCMAAAMRVAGFEAPLQRRSMDGCKSVHYEGMEDRTPVDGLRTEISLIDHSVRTCDDVRVSVVEGYARVFNPWTAKTTSYVLQK